MALGDIGSYVFFIKGNIVDGSAASAAGVAVAGAGFKALSTYALVEGLTAATIATGGAVLLGLGVAMLA